MHERPRPVVHPPRPSPSLLALTRAFARWEIARTLDGLHVSGLEKTQHVVRDAPVIFAATHPSWWDPLLQVVLNSALGVEGYALMDVNNRCRIPVFERLGGIPLDPRRPRAGLRMAASVLGRPRRAVWIFPQGNPRPAHLRPLGYRRGVQLLARLARSARVVPVALQYAFREAQGPAAYACFGDPLTAAEIAGPGGLERLERETEAALALIDAALEGSAPSLHPLIPSRWDRRARSAENAL